MSWRMNTSTLQLILLYEVTQAFTATIVESYTTMNKSDKKHTLLIFSFYEWTGTDYHKLYTFMKTRIEYEPRTINIHIYLHFFNDTKL